VADNFSPGKWEIKLSARAEARNLGLTLEDIARQVRAGFYGAEVQRVQRGRNEVKVMVRYPLDERRSRGQLERLRVRTTTGAEVPLQEVAAVDFGRGYSTISRVDGRRAITVTADLDETVANAREIVRDLADGSPGSMGVEEVLPFLQGLVRKYPGVSYDLEGQARQTRESMDSLKIGFVFALIAIFCLLASEFRAYAQPLIIMFAIPFGLTGAVLGHLVMGMPLTLISVFGMVALAGIVVNDSLVLIDFINNRVRDGIDPRQAVVDSGKARFRAVMLTSLTTIAGLLPLLLERSMQAQLLLPMAVSVVFGLTTATLLTLLVTPALYLILVDVRRLLGFESAQPMATYDASAEWGKDVLS